MSITAENIKKLGRLSRIRIEESQEETLAKQVSGILGWIEQMQEVDTDGVEPLTSVSDMVLKQREDIINDGNCQADVLANAPETSTGYFVVPKIIE